MPSIHMDPDQVRECIQRLEYQVLEMQSDADSLNRSVNRLTLAWISPRGFTFQNKCKRTLRETEHRLGELERLLQRVRREVEEWEQVDWRGQEHFKDCLKNPADERERQRLGDMLLPGGRGNERTYIIDTDQYDPFNIPDQYDQKGGNCILYGLLHLALMNGKTLTQAEIDALLQKYRPWWLPGSAGIPTFWIDDILRDLGLEFDREGFNFAQSMESAANSGADGWTYDIAPMQDKLLEHLKSGEPVYVITDSEVFGYNNGDGGHAYNVVGANLDEQGNIISVVVDTNWSSPNPMTLNGSDFLRDWAQQGCQMITVKGQGGQS